MTRRFEIGPLLVSAGALVLLVSLFLDWYGAQTAWGAFEITDVLLAVLAVLAIVAAAGLVAPELSYMDNRWLPGLVLAVAVLVTAQIISPPPSVGGADLQTGAWIGFAAALVMLCGAVLSLGRVSLAVNVEGREMRQRVPAVDHRQPTTETSVVAETAAREPGSGSTAEPEPEPAPGAEPAPEAPSRSRRRR